MKLEIEIGDRVRTVQIRRLAQGYEIDIDGRARFVDAIGVGANELSLLIREGDRSRSVAAVVLPRVGAGTACANGDLEVYIHGIRVPVGLRSGHGRRAKGAGPAQGSGPQRVVAPMPGKVVRVLVRAGDDVRVRQPLVVVEAMKMENELRATRDGRVRDVFVAEGQSVEAGAPLVVVE